MIRSYTADISFWNDTSLFFWWQVFENEALDTSFPEENLHLIFNIHVCCPSKPTSTKFTDQAESFNLVQPFKEPTHSKGHILDLVLFNSDLVLANLHRSYLFYFVIM